MGRRALDQSSVQRKSKSAETAGDRLSREKSGISLRQLANCCQSLAGRMLCRGWGEVQGEDIDDPIPSAGPEPGRWWVQGRAGIEKDHPPL